MPESRPDYYMQVTESIKSVYELTARVEERQQLMMSKVEQLERKIDKQMSELSGLDGRLRVVEDGSDSVDVVKDKLVSHEIRLQALEISQKGADNRWQVVASFALQIIWVLIAAYLLVKLGLQAPAVP